MYTLELLTYMYISMCVCAYVCAYVCVYVYVCMCVYVCVYLPNPFPSRMQHKYFKRSLTGLNSDR